MKASIFKCTWIAIIALTGGQLSAIAADRLYFPDDDLTWQRITAEQAGWDKGQLEAALNLAGDRNSSGVLVLHNGRILAERYWDPAELPRMYQGVLKGTDAAGRAIEDVASVQKSVVALLIGIAQQRGALSIQDLVSKHMGAGWSQAAVDRELAITVRHLLSMSSGLATDLTFEAEAGTRWRYNTPAYHLLMEIVCQATGLDRHELTRKWLTEPLGMKNTKWIQRRGGADAHFGLATTVRDLARVGLLVQAGGRWKSQQIIGDQNFLSSMLSPSQTLNPAYGYLWWLNGQEYSTPGRAGFGQAGRRRVRSQLIASAPQDLVAMQGALDRKLYLVPSLQLVVVRLGTAGRAGGQSFNDAFWTALMRAAP